MTTARNLVQDNTGSQRAALQGDRIASVDTIATLTTVGAGTILAAAFNNSILNRSGPTGAFTDTTDSASNIINALISPSFVGTGALNAPALNAGQTFRWLYRNTVAFAMTLAAGTGVTLGTNTGVSASSTREYLITILNGSQLQTFTANTTNTSAVVTGLTDSQTSRLSPGMLVSGTGIQAGSTILSVQPGVGVTLSLTANATGASILTFSPRIQIDGLTQGAL